MEAPSFWSDLRERFLRLKDSRQLLYAMEFPDGTFLLSGGPDDRSERKALQSQFVALAERAALAADLTTDGHPLDAWFRHLKTGARYRPIRLTTDSDGVVLHDLESGYLDAVCLSSAEACEVLETAAYAAEHHARQAPTDVASPLVRSLERLRLECGWTYEELAKQTGLDRKLVRRHIKHGKGARPTTIKLYADAFSRALKRPFTVNDLLGG